MSDEEMDVFGSNLEPHYSGPDDDDLEPQDVAAQDAVIAYELQAQEAYEDYLLREMEQEDM